MLRTPRSRRWAIRALAVYGAAAAVVVFTPVSYASVVHSIAGFVTAATGLGFYGSGWIEFVANVILFVPLGLLIAALVRPPWLGVILGMAISAGVELVQILIPYRQASVRDVISNTIGAAIGALVLWLLVRSRRASATDAPPTATRRAR